MPNVYLETYGRAVVVKGDTKDCKDFLKEKGGKWNKGCMGWIFPGSRGSGLLEELKTKGVGAEDRRSGGGEEAAPKAKAAAAKRPADEEKAAPKAKAAKVAEAADGEVVVEVAEKVQARISEFNGAMGVDVRHFYADRESGELKPTPKGLRLKVEEWQALRGKVSEADAALKSGQEEVRIEVTEEVFLQVRSGAKGKSVDVRRFYLDKAENVMKPGRKGVFLNEGQWTGLLKAAEEISSALGAGAAPAKAKTLPKAKAAAAAPEAAAPAEGGMSSAEMRSKLEQLLKGIDLQTVSLKQLRKDLEISMGLQEGALDERKGEVKDIVTELLNKGS